jgi:hypothetical protein
MRIANVNSLVSLALVVTSTVVVSGWPGALDARAFGQTPTEVQASSSSLPEDAARAVDQARATARQLGDELRTLLVSELEARGFEGAVLVCAEKAQARTEEIKKASGRDVRRVTLRPRNPTNTPDPWERKALEDFDRLPVKSRPSAERIEVVTEGGHRTLRFLKPLVTGSTCLVCHGDPVTIPPEIRAILATRYPHDRATGFGEGDVRGAISVRIPLPTP